MLFMMNILSWNVKGVVHMEGRRVIRELVQKHHLDIVIVLEPHCQFIKVSKLWHKLGFALMAVSKANGHLGGIWVLGLKGGVAFSVLDIFL